MQKQIWQPARRGLVLLFIIGLTLLAAVLLPGGLYRGGGVALQNSLGSRPAQATTVSVSTIQRVRARDNTLLVGVQYDVPPLEYADAQGELVGFNVELARLLAEAWSVDIAFVPVTAQNRIRKLAAGQVDLIALSRRVLDADQFTRGDPAAAASFAVSQPYFADRLHLLTRTDVSLRSFSDLNGLTVALITGVTDAPLVARVERNQVVFSTLPFREYAPAVAALAAGQVDVLAAPGAFAQWAVANNAAFTALELDGSRAPQVLAFAAGDPYFRHLVDYSLQQLQRSGAYQRLYTKWFPAQEPYTMPQHAGRWPYTFADSPVVTRTIPSARTVDWAQRARLVVGVPYDLPPFGFVANSDSVRGFNVDIARVLADYWLPDPAALELVPITPLTAAPMLAAGDLDLVIAPLTQTWEREEWVDFSQPYFVDRQALLVRRESGITALADLAGKTVAALDDAQAQAALRTFAAENNVELSIVPFPEHGAVWRAVAAGQMDAGLLVGMAASRLAGVEPGLATIEIPASARSYHIGLPDGDLALVTRVNETLQAMRRDGTYDALYRTWFVEEDAVPHNFFVTP